MTDPRTTCDVVVRRELAAPPQTVFAAFVDPVIAARWLFRTPEGDIVRAEADAQVGGEFCFIERRDDEDIVHVGEYLAIDPPRRLAFVFSLDQFRTVNEVTVDLEEAKTGGTLITLTHKLDREWAAFSERTSKVWELMLDTLQQVLIELA